MDPAVYSRNRAFRLYLSSKAGKQVRSQLRQLRSGRFTCRAAAGNDGMSAHVGCALGMGPLSFNAWAVLSSLSRLQR